MNTSIYNQAHVEKFSSEELSRARALSYDNWEKEETDIGFEFEGVWVTNPFVETSGRFEFNNFDEMCYYYGKEKVHHFIAEILSVQNIKV